MMHHKKKKGIDNIENKINLIKDFGASGVPTLHDVQGFELYRGGVPEFTYVPKSIDQFRRWGDLSLEITSTNKEAFDTYFNDDKALVSLTKLEGLLDILSAKLKVQKQELTQNKVDKLKSSIEALKELANQQNIVIAKYLMEIDSLEDELRTSKNSLVLAKEAIYLENVELRREINELRLRLKRLEPKEAR